MFNHFPTKLSILGEWFERFTHDVIDEAYRQKENGFCRCAASAGGGKDPPRPQRLSQPNVSRALVPSGDEVRSKRQR